MTEPEPARASELFIDARIVMSSDARILPTVRHAIWNLTLELGWNESESRAITLAVEEAVTNKIRHAYGNSASGRIQFEFRTEPEALVIRLTDQGEPPDPAKICRPRLDNLQPGGFGTHIIRDVMDQVIYQTGEQGNQLTLTKHFPRPEASK